MEIFKEKDDSDIMPVPRALFALFFMIGLFDRIQDFAKSKGYKKTFSSLGCFLGVVGFNLLGRLPEPYFIISFVSFLFFVPALEAFNYAIRNSTNYEVIETERFNSRQLILLIFGSFLWILILLGLTAE